MTPKLTLQNVLEQLEATLSETFWRQITDSEHATDNAGAIVNLDYGVADPSHGSTVPFLVGCGFLYLAHAHGSWNTRLEPTQLLARATAAAEYMLRAQRPSGLIDLLSTNYDSSPDTAFAVQQLCTLVELGRPLAPKDPALAGLLEHVETFIKRAAPGILTGGFHTPNHRWVIVSALAQTHALFPEIDITSVVSDYLAEGIDIDAEGTFIERSAGVYDAVSDRSLLLMATFWDIPEARAAANKNLNLNMHLLHENGTVVTGLSRRQDYGKAVVPLSLATPYLLGAQANPTFTATAKMLWEKALEPSLVDLCWLGYALLKLGDPRADTTQAPDDYTHHLPQNGLVRIRRGPLSTSFFRARTQLLAMHFGAAELTSLTIHQSFFGIGRFVADELEVANHTITLHASGENFLHKPGYELPLGRPVPPDRWEDTFKERAYRPLEPLASTLSAREVPHGFALSYRTLSGIDRVMTQISFDFPAGGIWETEDSCLKPVAGQTLFLKRGYGTMRYGKDAIRIGPGAHAHTTWEMRAAETAPEHVRVLMTFLTPIEHAFSILGKRGL